MLKRKAFLSSVIVAAVVVLLLVNIAWNFNLGALQKPGKAETFVATKAKHWLVARRSSRRVGCRTEHCGALGGPRQVPFRGLLFTVFGSDRHE